MTMRASSSSRPPPQPARLLDERAPGRCGRHALRAHHVLAAVAAASVHEADTCSSASRQGESRAVHEVVAEAAPAAPRRGVVRVRRQVERRRDARGHAAGVVADVAAQGLRVGKRFGAHALRRERGDHVARPHAVRHGHDDPPRGRAGGDGLGDGARDQLELGLGGVAAQDQRGARGGRIGGQPLVNGVGMRREELVDPVGIGVGIVYLDAGFRVARHGDRACGDEARQRLGGAARAREVVDQHVRPGAGGARFAAAAQVAHGEVRRLGLHDGAHEGQVRLQQRMDVGLLARQQPGRIVVGQLGPRPVEELEHLAQPLRPEPAHLHVLHEERLLEGGQQPRLPSRPAARAIVGQHVERQGPRGGHGRVRGALAPPELATARVQARGLGRRAQHQHRARGVLFGRRRRARRGAASCRCRRRR
ncbi:MAG: hypothetical protein ACLRG7_07285 [Eggerthella lenta]